MIVAGIIILVLLLAVVLIANYMYNITVKRNKINNATNNSDLVKEVINKYKIWWNEQDFKEIEITSFDGLKLKAHYLKSKDNSNKTIILAHGHLSRGEETGCFSEYYYSKGFNLLIPDNRAHGESEGEVIGFGISEKRDYLQWIDKAIELGGPDVEILLKGVSMGGAIVMMLSGEDLLSNVKCIIEDCGYTSISKTFAGQLKYRYKLPSFPIIQILNIICKIRAGYYLNDVNTIEAVKRSKTPILFVHGSRDSFVPVEMAHKLYDIASCPKELLIVEGANHADSFIKSRDTYVKAIEDFCGKYMK